MTPEVFNPIHNIEPGTDAPALVNAIIEIPKHSDIKYEIDKKYGILKLDRFLYSAIHYPGDYGFIPQTIWEDHDPIDVIILTGRAVYPLTLATIRVVGVIHMIDGGEADDKIIGVYEGDPRYSEIQDMQDIPKHIMAELKHFFETYKELQGKTSKVPLIQGKEFAYKIIEKGIKAYKNSISAKRIPSEIFQDGESNSLKS